MIFLLNTCDKLVFKPHFNPNLGYFCPKVTKERANNNFEQIAFFIIHLKFTVLSKLCVAKKFSCVAEKWFNDINIHKFKF